MRSTPLQREIHVGHAGTPVVWTWLWALAGLAGLAGGAYLVLGLRHRGRITALDIELSEEGLGTLKQASRPAKVSYDKTGRWLRRQPQRDYRLRHQGMALHWHTTGRYEAGGCPDEHRIIELHVDTPLSHLTRIPHPISDPYSLMLSIQEVVPPEQVVDWNEVRGRR